MVSQSAQTGVEGLTNAVEIAEQADFGAVVDEFAVDVEDYTDERASTPSCTTRSMSEPLSLVRRLRTPKRRR